MVGSKDGGRHRWSRLILRRILPLVILGLLAVATAVSFLPLIETNAWWVRYADFPRLQLATAIVLLLTALLGLGRHAGKRARTTALLAVVLPAAAVGYHAHKLYPYTGLSAQAAAGVEECPAERTLSVMVANVQKRNEDASEFLRLVEDVDPDVLLVMETDGWWDRRLSPLRSTFPEAVQHIPESHGAFGMHFFSKLRLTSPAFRFLFDADTPTLFTGIDLPNGVMVQFLGLHPRPPLAWSQPTALRDAHLLSAGLEARSTKMPTIVAGDFNAVPWEPATRRSARIGGLLDPRIGRGFYPTFRTDDLLISWPLDQILYQQAFGLLDFETLPAFGSDHFPVFARLCHGAPGRMPHAAPALRPGDLEEAQVSIEAARASIRDRSPERR